MATFSFLSRASKSNPKLLHLIRRNPVNNPNHSPSLSPLFRFQRLLPTTPNSPASSDPFFLQSRSLYNGSSPMIPFHNSRAFSSSPKTPSLPKTITPKPGSAVRNLSAAGTPEGAGTEGEAQKPELRHQEIVGPTVERDESALANETRQVFDGLARSIYRLSSGVALLGVAHLGLGAWIMYAVKPPEEVVIQGLAASGFPFAAAFLMRRALKPIVFFRKMEEQGRLQILTLALQVTKSVNQLLLRARVVSLCCLIGISAGSLAVLLGR
ncbi:hypothetical protein Cni_G21120 [Canna indica]|uniref:Uncharacterized protein n=1 Tax=Canna indica TaxID=4628 RepID=A0AAQ3KPD0_9LILI|nr:hypothetical protein Cni_G21120 [Canna indica]